MSVMKPGASTPLYQQIFEEIKAEIDRGEYKPLEKIPSEPELSQKYDVSRITVRRAIEELSRDNRELTIVVIAHRESSLEFCDRIITIG